jgi:RNA polymerase sigma-70 factor (ECF subfamily)
MRVSSPRLVSKQAEASDFEGMRPVLVRAVARHCPPALASQAEDLVQTALLRLLEHPPPEGSLPRGASYLWRVAFSVVIDEIRRRKRGERYQEEARSRATPDTPGPDIGAEIRDCLERLAEPRRVSVTLHLQGFRLSEVATALQWNEKRVENLIYRGLADLRRCLQGKELGDGR